MNLKKLSFLVALFCLLGLASPVSAQATPSPFFVKNLMVQKVYLYKNGYRVTYFGNGFKLQNLYIPIQWFSLNKGYKTDDGNRKAELFYGQGAEYPYVSIYWKEGKFHHLVLRVRQDFNDPSWGARTPDADSSDKFNPDADPEFVF